MHAVMRYWQRAGASVDEFEARERLRELFQEGRDVDGRTREARGLRIKYQTGRKPRITTVLLAPPERMDQ